MHDLGHGPFSHVSDSLFDCTHHEEITALFVESDPGIRGVLGKDLATRIAGILRGSEKQRTVVRDIVSGPADADKVDYLLRDSHYAGVEAGRFDYRRFIDQVRAINSRPDTLLFRWGGLWAVEGMLLARHHMHRTVYGHRNRLVTDFMLQRTMGAGIYADWLPGELFRPPMKGDVERYLAQHLEWDDWHVLSTGADAKGLAGDLDAGRLCARHLSRGSRRGAGHRCPVLGGAHHAYPAVRLDIRSRPPLAGWPALRSWPVTESLVAYANIFSGRRHQGKPPSRIEWGKLKT